MLLLEAIEQRPHEDDATTKHKVQAIQAWLRLQPHLPDSWDERCVLSFLRFCGFSTEKCKRKLEMYFKMRASIPEFFVGRDIARPELQNVIQQTHLMCMPGLTPDVRRVNIAAVAVPHLDIPKTEDFFKVVTMLADVRILEDTSGVNEDVYILDASSSIARQFLRTSPVVWRKFLVCAQEAFPTKIAQVHVVNANSFVDFVISNIKPFLKEKTKKRIYVHRGVDGLLEHLPRSVLPEEYGGSGGTLQEVKMMWVRKCEEYKEWFVRQEQVKARNE